MSANNLLLPNAAIHKARLFASTKHANQKYGDEFPYIIHPTLVEGVLLRFHDFDVDRRCAAYLHDTREDTNTTYEELVTYFGKKVADIVEALTEPKGGNRKWRHEMTYPRIAANQDALIVKLADRIANVEAGGAKVGMYYKEHADFKQHLGSAFSELNDQIFEMWNYLDSLIIALAPAKREPLHIN